MNGDRSFTVEHWREAQAAWSEGEFSDEWPPFRRAAGERGFIYPPEGTKWDSWGDEHPSQRAVLIQAIRERPVALMSAIGQARSWSQAIGLLVAENADVRDGIVEREREAAVRREGPGYREAVRSLAWIRERLP